ncbi:DoxX family protein [Sphingomonas bacterium]|uniref:DoxX family protein n=1 Tax=Sphingomonas bacterium TaxID=1895847 RepID=UPI001574F2C8|nr:DoxX family protein [Sphingomonas bacterium]
MIDGGESRGRRWGRWTLALVYAAAGVLHLVAAPAFLRIVPAWVPYPAAAVAATGVAELAGAAGLLTMRFRRAAGWALAAYAVCVFPANVQHAVHDLGTGTGLGWWYHAPRLFLQAPIAWWALWAGGAFASARPSS